jgi:hypothetical protein
LGHVLSKAFHVQHDGDIFVHDGHFYLHGAKSTYMEGIFCYMAHLPGYMTAKKATGRVENRYFV